ncbi:putative fungal transcriptional regulatory protein [Rosellinia necatrix]|uniref:Putative fungal transcriptional regulatory protein n=1 Tax=Rosellinia necatrix TaxID=77044 RepID=A0A1S7UNP5_ROSNE|nr:putative fungal transcriptional regulatory protein [Rosellinia necatrix]
MVGIPRSKGCRTCRRKKIKCDEQKPRCGQCRRGVRECEGYEQPTTLFRYATIGDFARGSGGAGPPPSHDQDVVRRSEKKKKTPDDDDDDNVVRVSSSSSSSHDTRVHTGKRPPRETRLGPPHQAHPYAVAAPPVPRGAPDPLVWAVQGITDRFLDAVCRRPAPRGREEEEEEAPLAWLGDVGRAAAGGRGGIDALPLATAALALGWAGHGGGQSRLADDGVRLYHAALRQLRRDLRTCPPRQALAVTAVFVAFELCQFGSGGAGGAGGAGGDSSGWLAHMKGVAAFLQALGPEGVSADPYLKIFSFCRVVFIMQGLIRRKPVCAGAHMWIHGPFRGREKNAYQRFYDLSAEACELLARADGLGRPGDVGGGASPGHGHEPEAGPGAAAAARVLRDMLGLLSRLRGWMRGCDVVGFSGPLRFPDGGSAARHRLDRARARGYPTALSPGAGWTSEALYWQRMMYNYWTLRLDLYMTILDNPVLGALLGASDDFRDLLTAELETRRPDVELAPAVLISRECRELASNVAINCTSACHSVSQSFGSLVAVYTLETAIRWYERHKEGAGQMDAELERHCREVLGGIKTEEAKDPCAFEVSILPDEVLRRNWC